MNYAIAGDPRIHTQASGTIDESGAASTIHRIPKLVKARAFSVPHSLNEEAEFDRWLERLSDLPLGLARRHAMRVRARWRALRRRWPALPLPIAGATADGALQLAWSSPALLLELDIHADGGLQWFARDRQSGAWAGSETPSPELPREADPWFERVASCG